MEAAQLSGIVDVLRSAHDGDTVPIATAGLLCLLAEEKAATLKASRHPLGFVHLELTPLLDLPAGLRLRLHLWPDRSCGRDSLGQLHDHAWALKSAVLLGGLTDVTFDVEPAPQGPYQGVRIAYGQANAFTVERRYAIRERSRRVVTAGHVYEIPSRTVHRTELTAPPAVTLLLAEDDPPGSPGPLVFGPYPSAGHGTEIRDPVPPAEAAALLLRLATFAEAAP